MRSSGAPWVRSPRRIATAVSTRPLPCEDIRSKPIVWNTPRAVGIRAVATRRSVPAGAAASMIRPAFPALLGCRGRVDTCRSDPARAEAVDLAGVEPELSENLVVVLADFRRSPGRHFVDAVNLQRAADRELQFSAGSLERNNNVVGA